MSSSEIAVAVRGLGKSYTISHQAADAPNTLAEAMLARLRHPLRRSPKETFWALKDVDFEIKTGEVVGIIGRNGAGKSTLLKILSRITEPTHGEIELNGRVGSLLEVGTGFHPELTGRENVYLNGAILGMNKAEIRKQFDAIVDFAGVEQFLDTPVKRYSSGMYVRLAFAVAAHLRSEILIVDEVLAVGDAEFQQKCMGRMKDVTKDGDRTVLFVSHNIASISALCDRCAFLIKGRLEMFDITKTVVERYLGESSSAGNFSFDTQRKLSSPIIVTNCSVQSASGMITGAVSIAETFTLTATVLCRRKVERTEVSFRICNAFEQPIFTTSLSDSSDSLTAFDVGQHVVQVTLPAQFLAPGQYSVSVGIHRPNVEAFDTEVNAARFEVEDLGSKVSIYANRDFGSILVNFPWKHWTLSDERQPVFATSSDASDR